MSKRRPQTKTEGFIIEISKETGVAKNFFFKQLTLFDTDTFETKEDTKNFLIGKLSDKLKEKSSENASLKREKKELQELIQKLKNDSERRINVSQKRINVLTKTNSELYQQLKEEQQLQEYQDIVEERDKNSPRENYNFRSDKEDACQ